MTREQIAQNAATIKNAGFPDDLNRWLKMTPEAWEANVAARERLRAQLRGEIIMSKAGPKEQALRDARATEMSGSENTAADSIAPKAPAKAKSPAKAKPEAKAKESKVRTTKTKTTKAAKKSASRTAIKGRTAAKAPEGGIRPGSKLETIVGLLKRPEGCTAKDALAATGWPTLSFPQQARAAGIKLRKEKEKGQPTRYYAA